MAQNQRGSRRSSTGGLAWRRNPCREPSVDVVRGRRDGIHPVVHVRVLTEVELVLSTPSDVSGQWSRTRIARPFSLDESITHPR